MLAEEIWSRYLNLAPELIDFLWSGLPARILYPPAHGLQYALPFQFVGDLDLVQRPIFAISAGH